MAASGTDWLRKQVKQTTPDRDLAVSTEVASAVEVEAWLQSHGVSYAPPTLMDMNLVDERRSRANQARPTAIVNDSVERFAQAIRNGAAMPPIVVYPTANKVVIIDGNNRHEAYKKARATQILTIVISESTSSELIQLLTVEANTRHGVTPDNSWRIEQGLALTALGFTDEQAAAACSVTKHSLVVARILRRSDARAKSLRIAEFNTLAASLRTKLGALKEDAVFSQAARLVISSGMIGVEVDKLVRELKSFRSEADRLRHISEISVQREVEAATKKVMGRNSSTVSSSKHSLVTGIGKVMAVDPGEIQRQILTEHDRDLLKERLKKLADRVLDLQVALEEIKFEEE